MIIAVEGCAHGALDAIYEELAKREQVLNRKVDLLLCCGDFEAIRNFSDLKCVAPSKSERTSSTGGPTSLRDFHEYYSGAKVAPVLTIFIGGNHEASNYLQELFYGGWVAPNIYYLGQAGCLRVHGIRIAGISGIYKNYDYLLGHYELPPYNHNERLSVIHYRAFHALRLKLLAMVLHERKSTVDIMLSHDWPDKIFKYGNVDGLQRVWPNFAEQVRNDSFSSPPLTMLLHAIQPRYWFSGHMHVSFKAVIDHSAPAKIQDILELPTSSEAPVPELPTSLPLGVRVDDEDDAELTPRQLTLKKLGVAYQREGKKVPAMRTSSSCVRVDDAELTPPKERDPPKTVYLLLEKDSTAKHTTHFQALDKCVAGSRFLQLYEIAHDKRNIQQTQISPPTIEHDPVWLAVLKVTNEFLPLTRHPTTLMGVDISGQKKLADGEWKLSNHDAIERQLEKLQKSASAVVDEVKSMMKDNFEVKPDGFCRNTPATSPYAPPPQYADPQPVVNTQTTTFCKKLSLTDPLSALKDLPRTEKHKSAHSYDNFGGRYTTGGRGSRRGYGGGRGDYLRGRADYPSKRMRF